MRVTKVIKEYVEREVFAKFQPRLAAIGKEYRKEQDELDRRLSELRSETEARAREIAASLGFELNNGCFDKTRATSYWKKSVVEAINAERNEVTARRQEAIDNILINLEIGATNKAELKDALDSVVV